MIDMDVSNEIEQPRASLINLNEALKYENYIKKKRNIRIGLIIGGAILAIILIIVIIVLAISGNSDNTYDKNKKTFVNIIKAKYFSEKDNETIKIINENVNKELNIDLFIYGEKKTFNNEYNFEEQNEYFIEFKFIKDLKNLSELFMNINNLKDIDLSGIKTDKVRSMDKLFYK